MRCARTANRLVCSVPELLSRLVCRIQWPAKQIGSSMPEVPSRLVWGVQKLPCRLVCCVPYPAKHIGMRHARASKQIGIWCARTVQQIGLQRARTAKQIGMRPAMSCLRPEPERGRHDRCGCRGHVARRQCSSPSSSPRKTGPGIRLGHQIMTTLLLEGFVHSLEFCHMDIR